MDEQMIERMAMAISVTLSPTDAGLTPETIRKFARAAHSVMAGKVAEMDPDVRRRLEAVAMTLETCGKHGLPIDFAMLAHDIRAALAPHPKGME